MTKTILIPIVALSVLILSIVPSLGEESCGMPPEVGIALLAGVAFVGFSVGSTIINAVLVPRDDGSRTAGAIGRTSGLLISVVSVALLAGGNWEAVVPLGYGLVSYDLGKKSVRQAQKDKKEIPEAEITIEPSIFRTHSDGYSVGFILSVRR